MIEDYLPGCEQAISTKLSVIEVFAILYRVKIALDQVRRVLLFTCFLAGSSNRVYYLL